MRQRIHRWRSVLAIGLLGLIASCDGANNFLAALGGGVRVIIENDTSYEAIPDIRTSDSTNAFADIFADSTEIYDFGNDGAVAAHQTVTFYLTCDGDLEHIMIGDIEFRDGDGDQVGSDDANASLRRDSDFDCGDTIHLRLSGGTGDFSAEVDVDTD